VTTVPADTILDRINGNPLNVPAILAARPGPPPPVNPLLLNIDEAATTRLVEIWVEFSLTPQQVEQESKFKHVVHHDTDESVHTGAPPHSDHQSGSGHSEHAQHHKHHPRSTAVTLATRAANVLSQAVDSVIFQGQIASAGPLVNSGLVGNRGNPVDFGLLCVGPAGPQNLPAGQVVSVPQGAPAAGAVSYAENTVRAIGDAYSQLQQGGHYGPYACVLFFYPFADSYGPLANTLILPADRINPLMTDGYFGTGTLPGTPNPVNPAVPVAGIPNPTNLNTQSMGLVVSTGGNTMDMVIGQDPVAAFSQVDQFGNLLLRLFTRFALRLKDNSAVIRLEFQ